MKLNSRLILGFSITLALFFGACSNDDEGPSVVVVEPANKSTGFLAVGTTSSGSAVVKYFEELPTSTVDLSDGTDFSQFEIRSIYDNTFYVNRTDGVLGFSKMVINSEGEIIEEATLGTAITRSRLNIRDSETGVFQSGIDSNVISIFNPTTFEVTGSIDMSAGFVPEGIDHRYSKFIFRGDDVFVTMRNNAGGTSPYFTDYIVHQANLSTNTFVGDTKREGNGFGTIRGNSNITGQAGFIDARSGDLYIPDAGNYEGVGIAARLNKIPAGSNEIDASYTFEPAVTLNPTNVFLPTFNSFTILESGKAIALVNAETPQEAIDIVIGAGGVANLTNAQSTELTTILFTAESGVWCEIDLNAETVTPIAGIPSVSVFKNSKNFEHNGDIYIPIITSTENAYYKWNPTTGVASKAFVMTGINNPSFYNLENNN